jgi:hypothetical protein
VLCVCGPLPESQATQRLCTGRPEGRGPGAPPLHAPKQPPSVPHLGFAAAVKKRYHHPLVPGSSTASAAPSQGILGFGEEEGSRAAGAIEVLAMENGSV